MYRSLDEPTVGRVAGTEAARRAVERAQRDTGGGARRAKSY